jgi:hypothetical protein
MTRFFLHHHKRRAAPQLREQHGEIVARQRDAASGRCITWPRKMHEDGAAASSHPRAVVVTKHENEIVEMIVAGQAVGARRRRQLDESVVAAIRWVLAPTIVGANGAQRKLRPWPWQSVGAVEHLADGKPPKGRRAIALPLQRLGAAPAERRAPHAVRQEKAPFPWISGCAPQRDVPLNSHDQLTFSCPVKLTEPLVQWEGPPYYWRPRSSRGDSHGQCAQDPDHRR